MEQKEKLNPLVYIKGVPGRGKEVITKLIRESGKSGESMGLYISDNLGIDPSCIYYMSTFGDGIHAVRLRDLSTAQFNFFNSHHTEIFLSKPILDEKERVYYRGDEIFGDEIIADLEKRGGKNVDNYTASIRDDIYFINQFGLIDVAEYDYVKNSLDGWTELHLPPKKVKKEGWINIQKSKSMVDPFLGGVYNSEKEAKEAAESLREQFILLKTTKIDWEEQK